MSQVYLVTGANRGLGASFVATYLARPATTVIAAVRDPSKASSQDLKDLPTGEGSALHLVKIDAQAEGDPAAAVADIKAKGVAHIDVVVANAGISDDFALVAEVPPATFRRHMETNGYGPLYLFQAVLPLLTQSKNPKWVAVGSPLGSIGGMIQRPFRAAAYGPSKAVLHWLSCKIHFEHESITSVVIDPGFVQTDMGNLGAQTFGFEKAFVEVKDSINGMVPIIDKASRLEGGPKLLVWDGTEFPW